MDDTSKVLIECKTEKRVVKVDEAAFNDHVKKYNGNVMLKQTVFIKNIFTSAGEYIGSCTNRLYVKDTDPSEYFIPVGDDYE